MMPKILVLFGVAGCGKTSVGLLLAEKLGFCFLDADAFHSAENVDKMSRGVALNDQDRLPWLLTLHEVLRDSKTDSVLACSALKRAYRFILIHGRSTEKRIDHQSVEEIIEKTDYARLRLSDYGDANDDGAIAHLPRNWPTFVHLKGNKVIIRDRMMKRSDHFMSTRLIDSQFEALEEVDDDERERLNPSVLTSVDISAPMDEVVGEIIMIMGKVTSS